jgi:hypothetical protein
MKEGKHRRSAGFFLFLSRIDAFGPLVAFFSTQTCCAPRLAASY